MSTAISPAHPAEMTCPSCGATVPVDPGFVAWCAACEWNVQPTAPVEQDSLLGRAFTALGRRSGRQLFERLAGSAALQPGRSVATALAFLGAGLVHALTLGLAVGGALLIASTWFSLGPALLGALALATAWLLRPRLGQLEEPPLARSQAPTLFALVDRVAQALGHPPVAALVLDASFNASYGRVGWRGLPVVTLGLPLLAVLKPQQLVALLAHELAHGVNGDPVRGTFIHSAVGALQAWYTLLHPRQLWEPERGLMAYPALLSNILLLGLAQLAYAATYLLSVLAWRDAQRAEYLADDLAARVAGASAELGLLAALHYDAVVAVAVQGLALGRGEGNLLDELGKAAEGLPARERERLRRAGLREGARIDATHPPTALRIAMLERRPPAPPQLSVSPAEEAALLSELRALEPPIRRRLIDAYRSHLYAG